MKLSDIVNNSNIINNLVDNSSIELKEDVTQDNIKGRKFISRFIEPGIVNYADLGNVLVKKETLDKFIYSIVGCPVVIKHKDITAKNVDKERVGVISRVSFNTDDGWYYCEGIIWDATAIDLIKNQGWTVSCTYEYVSDFAKKKYNDINIDMEFTDGKFLYLALVDNPRYTGANIVINSRDDINTDLINLICNYEATDDELPILRELMTVCNSTEIGHWITVNPNKDENGDSVGKGRHIFIKEGETAREAIDRVYGDKNKTAGDKDKSGDKPDKTPQPDKTAGDKTPDSDKATDTSKVTETDKTDTDKSEDTNKKPRIDQLRELKKKTEAEIQKNKEAFAKSDDLKERDKLINKRADLYDKLKKINHQIDIEQAKHPETDAEMSSRLKKELDDLLVEYDNAWKQYRRGEITAEEREAKTDPIMEKYSKLEDEFHAVNARLKVVKDVSMKEKIEKAVKEQKAVIDEIKAIGEKYEKAKGDREALSDKALNLHKELSHMINTGAKQEDIDMKQSEWRATQDKAYALWNVDYKKEMQRDIANALRTKDGAPMNYVMSTSSRNIHDHVKKAKSLLDGIISKKVMPEKGLACKATRRARSYYLDSDDTINMSSSYVDVEAVLHETMHWLEANNPQFWANSRGFLNHRTKDSPVEKLTKYIHSCSSNEMTKADKFYSAYCGKIYGDGSTEIMSMGIERLFKHPVEFAKEDPEYMSFVIANLRGEL